jgi:hypothetical protein
VQNGQPPQPEQQLGARREIDARHRLHRLDIDVRLIEPVEYDETGSTCSIELLRHVPEGRKERDSFTATGILRTPFSAFTTSDN